MNIGSVDDTARINPASDATAAAAAAFAVPPFAAPPPYAYGYATYAVPPWACGWAPPPGFASAAAAAPAPEAAAQAGGNGETDEDLAGGDAGALSGLTQMLNLDDREFWKGALVGAAAVLLLTNESVQRALFRGAVKGREAVQGGVQKATQRAGGTRRSRSGKKSNKAQRGAGHRRLGAHMSDYNRISRTLLQPVTTTLGGVVIGAATVQLVQRWLAAARARQGRSRRRRRNRRRGRRAARAPGPRDSRPQARSAPWPDPSHDIL